MGQLLDLRVLDSVENLTHVFAGSIVQNIRETLRRKEHFDLVLTGGDSPRPLYKYLADNYREKIPWEKIRFYWSDERYLPHADPQSNYGMARETLLDHVGVDPQNIFPMPTNFTNPVEAAESYEKLLRSHFKSERPHFDLMLLGLGEDCHIASLFPRATAIEERKRWVVASVSPKEPTQRLSLTFSAINGSKNIYFLVTGENKAEALDKVFSKNRFAIEDCPARGVNPVDGKIIWWADKTAAKLIRGA